MKKTPLYEQHINLGAKMVDFAGWEMPIHYGSQIDEHHAVRQHAGMFDVSHMMVTDFIGAGCYDFFRYLLANDVAKLEDDKALYSCMLNDKAGVIDDLIVYRVSDTHYKIVSNAGTRDKDLAWFQQQAKAFDVTVTPQTEACIIALQGPAALDKLDAVFTPELIDQIRTLKPFRFLIDKNIVVARTGYTGEDGVEIIVPQDQVQAMWNSLIEAGVKPCGLGARDTLRLEAGLSLYGHEMDDQTSPLIANLAWTVAMKDERDFIGRKALEQQKSEGLTQKLVGLVLIDRGVLRAEQVVKTAHGSGVITSGTFSPTLKQSIALARVPIAAENECQVDIRGKLLKAKIVKPAFVRMGASLIMELA